MVAAAKLLLTAILIFFLVNTQALNKAEEYDLRGKIRKMITEDGDIPELTPGGGGPMELKMVAGLVRLAFHDCVGKKCDGCINKKNPENAGLEFYIEKTEKLYQKVKNTVTPKISRADFWALAALEAIDFAVDRATCRRCKRVGPVIKMKTGRKDCAGSPNGSPWTNDWHEFPDPLGTTKDTTSYFKKMFDFGDMETVAILGAHTLGQAHPSASGFSRPWVPQKNRFNNDYYKALLKKQWTQVSVRRRPRQPQKWQWENNDERRGTMMLNCDMSMLKNLTDVSKYGEVRGCTYKTCKTVTPGESNTAVWVKKFAADNALFMEKFGKAFQKMIRHGYTNLQDVDPYKGFG